MSVSEDELDSAFHGAGQMARLDSSPQNTSDISEDGRGEISSVNAEGFMKVAPKSNIDRTRKLQVWRVDANKKTLLLASEQVKFYTGDCYIFRHLSDEKDKEYFLVGTWFGKNSVQEDRTSAARLASEMVDALVFVVNQARFYEGNEPIEFFDMVQNFIIFKGGLSEGYKKYIAEKEIPDDTYNENGVALFRVQGSGPNNMQAIQVDLVASSLNSSYCYILHSGSTVFIWKGSLVSTEEQKLVQRQLDVIKPNLPPKMQKEGAECQQFWELLGGKSEYLSSKITRESESDPCLFSCTYTKGVLKVTEIQYFTKDDLMDYTVYLINCRTEIFVWVGKDVQHITPAQALAIGETFVERNVVRQKVASPEVPIFVINEASDPPFFNRVFTQETATCADLLKNFDDIPSPPLPFEASDSECFEEFQKTAWGQQMIEAIKDFDHDQMQLGKYYVFYARDVHAAYTRTPKYRRDIVVNAMIATRCFVDGTKVSLLSAFGINKHNIRKAYTFENPISSHEPPEFKDNVLYLFCDGSSLTHNKIKYGGWGYLILYNGTVVDKGIGVAPSPPQKGYPESHIVELCAINLALRAAYIFLSEMSRSGKPQVDAIYVLSDCESAIAQSKGVSSSEDKAAQCILWDIFHLTNLLEVRVHFEDIPREVNYVADFLASYARRIHQQGRHCIFNIDQFNDMCTSLLERKVKVAFKARGVTHPELYPKI